MKDTSGIIEHTKGAAVMNEVSNLRFDAFAAVAMKRAVFWDMMMPCGSCKNHMMLSYPKRQLSSLLSP
jgi:cytidine deaminase